jgi:hypothetical protein
VNDLGSFAFSTGVWDVLAQLARPVLPAHFAPQAVPTYFWRLGVLAYFTNTERVRDHELVYLRTAQTK